MTSAENKLPNKVNEYIRRHFREDFLFTVKNVRRVGPRTHYSIDVTKDDYIYHLKFDERGWLVRKEVEAAYPE